MDYPVQDVAFTHKPAQKLFVNNPQDFAVKTKREMAKELGLTQEKIRQLKIKKQARYPVPFDWKKSLLSIRNNIRYEDGKIMIPMRDPNLYIEICNFIEENGGYIDVQRSGNVI